MRQHASKQNAIPNNLRVIQSSASKPLPTKDINQRRSNIQLAEANTQIPAISTGSQITTEQNAICTENVSVNSRSDSGVAVSGDTNKIPSVKITNLKTSRVKDTRDAKAKRNEWRITKMVLAIFLSFVMCYLPITVAKIADKDVSIPAFHIIGYILLYLSSCINPIIYVIMNKQYRQAYKTVILCKPGRLLAFTQAGSSMGGKKWWELNGKCEFKFLEMSFRFREMERCRIQLQPQSYHGITGFPARGAAVLSDSSFPPRLDLRLHLSSNANFNIQLNHSTDSPHPRRLPDIRGSTDPW